MAELLDAHLALRRRHADPFHRLCERRARETGKRGLLRRHIALERRLLHARRRPGGPPCRKLDSVKGITHFRIGGPEVLHRWDRKPETDRWPPPYPFPACGGGLGWGPSF